MKEYRPGKIIQLIPANPGWFVSYMFENGKVCNMPIAFWALWLYEDEEKPCVRPFTVDGQGQQMTEADEDSPNSVIMGEFIGIIAPGETEYCGIVHSAMYPNASYTTK